MDRSPRKAVKQVKRQRKDVNKHHVTGSRAREEPHVAGRFILQLPHGDCTHAWTVDNFPRIAQQLARDRIYVYHSTLRMREPSKPNGSNCGKPRKQRSRQSSVNESTTKTGSPGPTLAFDGFEWLRLKRVQSQVSDSVVKHLYFLSF